MNSTILSISGYETKALGIFQMALAYLKGHMMEPINKAITEYVSIFVSTRDFVLGCVYLSDWLSVLATVPKAMIKQTFYKCGLSN